MSRKSFNVNSLISRVSFSVVFKTVITKGKDYKDVIKLWAGPKLLVFLADPRDIELILSSQVYLDKSPEYRFFKPWLGNGLLISSGKLNSSQNRNEGLRFRSYAPFNFACLIPLKSHCRPTDASSRLSNTELICTATEINCLRICNSSSASISHLTH
jgi:hypothetical protein